MAAEEVHIIKRQIIELEIPSQNGALELQRKVSRLFQEEVARGLNRAFQELKLGTRKLIIPKLEIDLGPIHSGRVEKEFVEKCIRTIAEKVKDQALLFDHEKTLQERRLSVLEVFFHFLKKGTITLNTPVKQLAEIEEVVSEVLDERPILIKEKWDTLPRFRAVITERLLQQFSPTFVLLLIEKCWPETHLYLVELKERIERFLDTKIAVPQLQVLFRTILLNYTTEHAPKFIQLVNEQDLKQYRGNGLTSPEKQLIKKLLQRALTTSQVIDFQTVNKAVFQLLEQTTNPFSTGERSSEEIETEFVKIPYFEAKADFSSDIEYELGEDLMNNKPASNPPKIGEKTPTDFNYEAISGYYIENAGLVICGYYLNTLFNGFGFIEDDKFKSKTLQHRAIHLTQYLVTGEESTEEFHLLLNKLLCGLPLQEPLSKDMQLTTEEKDESHNLLKHLIQHWAIIKDSSVESLQNTFLQRRGKLSFVEGNSSWLLQVEKKGFDICVERLPWSISIIKLPWMREALYVEWA